MVQPFVNYNLIYGSIIGAWCVASFNTLCPPAKVNLPAYKAGLQKKITTYVFPPL